MLTLESAVAVTLAIVLVFTVVALAPPLYLMTRQAARLEVLAVCEQLGGHALYRISPLRLEDGAVSGLQTGPQKVLELLTLLRDYHHWLKQWMGAST
ncbi:MAG: hypothetical protein GX173_14810 [Ruminococcaceae bacterium]|nr:hypothetical protein [Oscillospiraceae bacterium]